MRMIERLLPECVAAASTQSDVPESSLFPEERALVADAVEKRRREFAAGRFCAREALARLDVPPGPILTGARGAPRWPLGIVGSITHCDGYRGCAVARSRDLLSLGIDAEPNEPLPAGTLEDVALPEERAMLERLGAKRPTMHWDRLLFSIKESTYKAWFPLTGRWLGFEDAAIAIDPDDSTFTAQLLVPGPVVGAGALTRFEGRWLASGSLLLSAIAHPAPPRAAGGEGH